MQDQTTLSDLERDVRGPPEYDLTLSKSTESTGYSSKDQDDAWEPESSASKDKGWQKPKSTAWQKEKSTGWQPYQAHAYTPAKAIDKVRPSIPYAQLIAEAIESTPEGKITLNGIYNHVTTNYPYFQNAGAGWKVRF